LTSIGGCEGVGWIKTKYANQSDDWPDIEFHFVSGTPVSDGGISIRYNDNVKDSTWNSYYKPLENTDTWQVIPMLLRPLSIGTIRLASTDPYAKPLIDPQYFSNILDLDTIVEGLKIGLALSKTEAFQKVGSKFYDKIFPGCEGFTPWTDDYWRCFVRHYSLTIYHPSGTCKMGPSSDSTAVVDSQLRVYGIQRLRVADASIMPYVVSFSKWRSDCNLFILFTQIMIGEKVSDMIKNTWPTRRQGDDDDVQGKKSKGNKKKKRKQTSKP